MAPLPKPPGQRRRERPSSAPWVRLAPVVNAAPAMPEAPDGGWVNEAVRAWSAWWASPMSAAWIEADEVALRRALRLVHASAKGDTAASSALTALEDRMGLTPLARRRLQWEIRQTTEREEDP
jgi:hypothetical protein